MTTEELYSIIGNAESYRLEKTTSTGNMDKFQEAICAFANDLTGKREKGYLLIGVTDDGKVSGLNVDDTLLKKISGIRSDGNILPLPMMTTEKVTTPEGDVLVVEVTPSFNTPVRYRGRTFVRIGPRRDIASIEEERILTERCAASLPTFDTQPCREAKFEDIDVDTIVKEYLPLAIDEDTLANDTRPLKEQLASLHLFNMQWDCPTYAALIMFGRNPKYFMPGAYIQYVHFKGNSNGGEILNERRFEGCLYKILPELENFIRDGIVTKRPVPVSILRERDVLNYPFKALRELMMNAVMHRDYQANMPTRLYQYDNHIEIMNPGGLYGQARPENFPHVNDYRNSVVAGIMKTLSYVNMFNHGIGEVQDLLRQNDSPEAVFNVDYITAFSVVVNENVTNCSPTAQQTFTNLSPQACLELALSLPLQVKSLIISIKDSKVTAAMLQLASGLSPKSKDYFKKHFLNPAIEAGMVAMTYPDNPRHPQQKYYLTELGMEVLKLLIESDNKK